MGAGWSATTAESYWEDFVYLTHGAFNSPMWPIKSQMALEEWTVDYREVNKVVSPIHVAVPNSATTLDNLSTALEIYAIQDLANVFRIAPAAGSQDQFAFTWRVNNGLSQCFLKAIYTAPPHVMEWRPQFVTVFFPNPNEMDPSH